MFYNWDESRFQEMQAHCLLIYPSVYQMVRVMVLGGYGGTGRPVSRRLMEQLPCEVVVAGRDLRRAQAFAEALAEEFPGRDVTGARVDARDAASLKAALQSIDLLIVTTTTPDAIPSIVQAALATNTDTIDVMFKADVYDRLAEMRSEILSSGHRVITQAGCHPGLVAPLVKYASQSLAQVHSARVFMAFGSFFDSPSSARELIEECTISSARVLEGGTWRDATYKDSAQCSFGGTFGNLECYPLRMLELEALEVASLGLRDAASYAAGFNWFVDYLVLPSAMVLGRRSVDCLTGIFNWAVRFFGARGDGVVFRAELEGTSQKGQSRRHSVTITSPDAYDFTAVAVVSCVAQILDGSIIPPGLHLMGSVVDPDRTLRDVQRMGATLSWEDCEKPPPK
ncbi:unnamed protein product [Symbiodinium necroappetens]|uniref:Saccharopine dehydrogenase NADP binding domain-containing protein n=1 Tax=Symbiodinium necroappetens TaxID=1628268 RepID=A0A812K1V8_9DINO|nr:unnamed protein product [Symbiodinium necroappetens]